MPRTRKTGREVIVSEKNSKMGDVKSISLPPVKTCGNSKLCRKYCYARTPYKLYPNTRKSYDHNLKMYALDPVGYFTSLKSYLVNKAGATRKPKVPFDKFRFHVSGDIIDQNYMEGMVLCAEMLPQIQFLCFTKMYTIADNHIREYGGFPQNLEIVLSAWPGLELFNPHELPVAWVQTRDKQEDRIPKTAKLCEHMICDQCASCWNLSVLGHDVYFMLKGGAK